VTGRRNPTLQVAREIAEGLGMTLEELLGSEIKFVENLDELEVLDALRHVSDEQRALIVKLVSEMAGKNAASPGVQFGEVVVKKSD
jgi:transcriptional regulator with XRE-family HTH domain